MGKLEDLEAELSVEKEKNILLVAAVFNVTNDLELIQKVLDDAQATGLKPDDHKELSEVVGTRLEELAVVNDELAALAPFNPNDEDENEDNQIK